MARTPEEALQCLLGKLTNAKPVKPKAGETTQAWSACCPAHEDRGPSLSVSLSTSGKILLHCHANCSTAAVLAAVGMTAADLMPAREEKEHRPRERFDLAVLAAAKSLPIDHLRALGVSNAGRGSVKIEYRLADGTPAQRHRLRMRMHDPGRFAWTDGEGSPVPYGLWRLGEARAAGTLKDYLVLVEGESDCWVGWLHGIQMLGLPGSKMTHCLAAEHLEGISRVLVIREPGQGGAEFTKGVGERLATIGWKGEAKEVELPAKDPGDLHTKLGANSVDFISSFKAAVARGKPLGIKSRYHILSSAEFDDTDYTQRFLIDRILVEGQPAICGGRSKTLKTTLMVDLALSIGTGTKFLGKFDSELSKVWMMSGESGGFTLKETAKRICRSKGIRLRDVLADWCFDLPQLGAPSDIDELRREIEARKTGVLIIDPAYLCLLAGAASSGLQVSNLFHTGPLLLGISKLGAECGCTVILCHHCKKGVGTGGQAFRSEMQAPELEDLAMAGFAEWARQWLLLGRREAFEPGTGKHKLWINVGGSAGHSGIWAIDADEGSLESDFSGRKWDVSVLGIGEAKEDADRAKKQKKSDSEQRTIDNNANAVRKTLAKIGKREGGAYANKTRLSKEAGISGKVLIEALEVLEARGELEIQSLTDGRNKYFGYRLIDPVATVPFVPGDAYEPPPSGNPEDIDIGDVSSYFDSP